MRGLCKLIANVSKERGEKKQPWQPEPEGPLFGLQEKLVSIITGKMKRNWNWEKTEGKARRQRSRGRKRQAGPVLPLPSLRSSVYKTPCAVLGS